MNPMMQMFINQTISRNPQAKQLYESLKGKSAEELKQYAINVAHLLARCSKDKLDNKKDIHAKDCDTDIVQDLIQKFPLVSKDFMNKNTVEQNIENNQEIHEINIRLYDIEKSIEEIRRTQRGGL